MAGSNQHITHHNNQQQQPFFFYDPSFSNFGGFNGLGGYGFGGFGGYYNTYNPYAILAAPTNQFLYQQRVRAYAEAAYNHNKNVEKWNERHTPQALAKFAK